MFTNLSVAKARHMNNSKVSVRGETERQRKRKREKEKEKGRVG